MVLFCFRLIATCFKLKPNPVSVFETRLGPCLRLLVKKGLLTTLLSLKALYDTTVNTELNRTLPLFKWKYFHFEIIYEPSKQT